MTAEVDEAGLVVRGPAVEFAVGEDSSLEELTETVGVGAAGGVVLVLEEDVEGDSADCTFSTRSPTARIEAALPC